MKKNLLYLFLLVSACIGFYGCGSDPVTDEPPPTYTGQVTLVSTTLANSIGWYGETASFVVKTDAEKEGWRARLVINGKEGEPIDFPGNTSSITIPRNLNPGKVPVIVEAFSEEKWVELASAEQLSGAITLGDNVWAPGNLTVIDEKFSFSLENEFGSYFRHNSEYAVPGEGNIYGGIVYKPEATEMAWADIPKQTGVDPCRMVQPSNTWCTPNLDQLFDLLDEFTGFIAKDGVHGALFGDNIFLPSAGTRLLSNGDLAFVGTNGGYFGRGADEDGFAEVLIFSEELGELGGALVYYSLTENLGSLRCVRMDGTADYVSHSPETGDATGFELTVTAAGDKPNFTIAIQSGLDLYEEVEVTSANPVATFIIPEWDELEPRRIDIFVDHFFTGKYSVQSGIKDYAFYQSHTPQGTVAGDAFELKVTAFTDMDSFDVNVYTDDSTVDITGQGSASDPVVTLNIPANHSGSSRVLKIKVNGEETGQSVIQEYRPENYGEVSLANVTWAKGNLVLKGGAFEIGEPEDFGLYFKYLSNYGFLSSVESYNGTVYSPAAASMAWGDIPLGVEGSDPCRLVAPANSWRLPTGAELQAMHNTAGENTSYKGVNGRHYAGNEFFLPTSGMMYTAGSSGARTPQHTYGYIRSSGKEIMSFSDNGPSYGNGIDDYGYSVRCVKRANYADYVSHTPTGDQGSAAFTLTVVCATDLATFPVQVKGTGVDITKNGTLGNPTVSFDIPANTEAQTRGISIIVNNVDTGVTVIQEGAGGVEWSTGHLTIKDGNYTFAEPMENGMFFKYNSPWGALGGGNFQGYAFGPQQQSFEKYSDIPFNEGIDPCSLVSPVNTWRMPTREEFEELLSFPVNYVKESHFEFDVNGVQVVLKGQGGSLVATTGNVGLAHYLYLRTTTPGGTGHNSFTQNMRNDMGVTFTNSGLGVGVQVRCVK